MSALLAVVLRFLLALFVVRALWSLVAGRKRGAGERRSASAGPRPRRFDTSGEKVTDAEYRDVI